MSDYAPLVAVLRIVDNRSETDIQLGQAILTSFLTDDGHLLSGRPLNRWICERPLGRLICGRSLGRFDSFGMWTTNGPFDM